MGYNARIEQLERIAKSEGGEGGGGGGETTEPITTVEMNVEWSDGEYTVFGSATFEDCVSAYNDGKLITIFNETSDIPYMVPIRYAKYEYSETDSCYLFVQDYIGYWYDYSLEKYALSYLRAVYYDNNTLAVDVAVMEAQE